MNPEMILCCIISNSEPINTLALGECPVPAELGDEECVPPFHPSVTRCDIDLDCVADDERCCATNCGYTKCTKVATKGDPGDPGPAGDPVSKICF